VTGGRRGIYFAQRLGPPYPVSDKRVLQAMEQVSGT
ncbi:hypothetical protein, partial [Cronobacter sakazakii]